MIVLGKLILAGLGTLICIGGIVVYCKAVGLLYVPPVPDQHIFHDRYRELLKK